MSKPLPWYKEGLRFECTGCGGCCTGAPGYVWVSLREMEEIALFLNISFDEFTRHYVRKVGKKYSLIELAPANDCVFLKDKKCSIYSVRPMQCRTFPFWVQNLKSKEDWQQAARCCEGISECAPLVPLEKIQEISESSPI